MINFILKRQPKAYQGSKTFKSRMSKENYINSLIESINHFNLEWNLMNEDLYGIVYYFRKKNTGTDADNISKPIWDSLNGYLFKDDKQIKLRTSGIIDISNELNIVDFSNLRGEIVAEFIEAIDTTDHFVYIECGYLENSMFKFKMDV